MKPVNVLRQLSSVVHNFRYCTGLSILGLSLAVNSATAQSALDDEDVIVLDAFEVKGFRSSLADSLEQKRRANQVVDSINSEEVGQFPDQNIAEAIQRLSGVSLTRVNGEGESITVRGLSPNFTRVEIDGRTTTVTSDQANPGRSSVLSTFSSDLYSSIEVIKSPTAADIEGGIGGIVRLKTPDPLDIGELSWGMDASYTDADLRDDAEIGYSAFWTNTFMENRLGILVSGTWEDRDRRIDKIQSNQSWIEVSSNDPALDGARYPGRLRYESRAGEAPRLNLNAKLQFQVNDNLELYLNGLYTIEERNEDRSRIQSQFSRGRLITGTVDASTGTLTSGEFSRVRTDYRSFNRIADISTEGITGGLKWEGDYWNARLEASFASSEEDFEETRVDRRFNRENVSYDIRNSARHPIIVADSMSLQPSEINSDNLRFQRRIISTEDSDLEFDLERIVEMDFFTSFQTGLRFSSYEITRRQGNVNNGDPEKANGDPVTFADGNPPYVLNGDFGHGQGGEGFPNVFPESNPVILYGQYPSSTPFTFNDGNLYDITEDTLAAYIMGNFETDIGEASARGNFGVRVVNTQLEGSGFSTINGDPVGGDGFVDLEQDYTEVLPAFNLVVAPNDSNFQIRGAITRALSRPEPEELNPAISVDDTDVERGNPNLDPYLAWQYDLGIEYYFGENQEGLFSTTFFYKDVESFVFPSLINEPLPFDVPGVDPSELVTESFANGGNAEISGFELSLQSPFTFLPGRLANFGGLVNYTYTDSETTDLNGVTIPFPGASENTYNIILYYEDGGFSTRLAYNYRDDYLIEPSRTSDENNLVFGEAQGRLDWALRYRFESGLRLSLDVLNITEEQRYLYYDTTQRLEDLEFEGIIYSLSVAWIF